MKQFYLRTLCLVLIACPAVIYAQLDNGGINAYFGVDADTRANYVKYGSVTGSIFSDDWFSPSLSGYNVIDTSNASYYLSQLQANNNITFSKRMSQLLYAKINGKLWLDAGYGRDYIAASSLKDSTTFTTAGKNGDNPANWNGGVSSFPNKNDLVDVFGHMRRDGITATDSLWFFTGVSTYGTTGSRYFDVELFKNNLTYDAISGKFSTTGPDSGHTQWLFDASGNVTQTGDLIVAFSYSPGAPPTVDVRIWVSQKTYSTVTPSKFNFGANFDGSTPSFGYASIVTKSGSTNLGSGIANYSATPAQDTTYSTPWGTAYNGTTVWTSQYQSLQFIEVGLNLTRIGIDPALYYPAINPCSALFSSMFFKSRSSNAFTSNLQDFVTPVGFVRPAVMDYTLKPDTLRCNRTTGTIQITNNSTMGYYTWKTMSGNISGSNSDSSVINVSKAGTYIVTASPAYGCPATRVDTVVIPIDTFPPVASIKASLVGSITSSSAYFQFYGGDTAKSNYNTPFGGSKGLLWNWSGPNGFSSTIQNPATTDTAWGVYQLTVTEKRNGCTATVQDTLSFSAFTLLNNDMLNLTAASMSQDIQLNWQDNGGLNVTRYIIEKSLDGSHFNAIGEQSPFALVSGSTARYMFTDQRPAEGNNFYRIKSLVNDNQYIYSNVVNIKMERANGQLFYLANNHPGQEVLLIGNCDAVFDGDVTVYNLAGQLIFRQSLQLNKGTNVVRLSMGEAQKNGLMVLNVVSRAGKHVFTGKMLF